MLATTLLAASLFAQQTDPQLSEAQRISQQVREARLDVSRAFRVRDLLLTADEARVYLNEGILVFLQPVNGRTIGAVFTAEVEAGDAEVLVLPPSKAERQSLAKFTKSPNLDEHFRSALFLFTNAAGERLQADLAASEWAKPAPEEARLLEASWNPTIRNVAASFEIRLLDDLLSGRPPAEGFFYAAFAGRTLGNFDLIVDPRDPRPVSLGQLSTRNNRTVFDIWTHFRSRKSGPPLAATAFAIRGYEIESRLGEDLHVSVTSRIRIEAPAPLRALPFEISPRMTVSSVEVNGRPATIFRRSSLRLAAVRQDQNEAFLVVPPEPLPPGPHEIVVRNEGDVITHSGNQVYFVGARINWYPQSGLQFAPYQLTFRYPKRLNLVSSCEVVSEKTEAAEHVTVRRCQQPVRIVGFNLGEYATASLSRQGLRVEVFANRRLESALEPRMMAPPLPPPTGPAPPGARRRFELPAAPPPPSMPLSPTAKLEKLASDVAEEFLWMTEKLGPPPLKTLSVSPIPGQFGQGFPGLLYLSTLSYLDVGQRFAGETRLFFSELLHAHETAHQWWGNSITAAGYEDEWIQEGLASYLALATLERRHGVKALDSVLEEYKGRLLAKDSDGEPIESAGAIHLGTRLQPFSTWRTITYDKGVWIIHMMRRRLGEALFWPMLRDLAQRYQGKSLSATQLKAVATEYLAKQPNTPEFYRSVDPQWDRFFETWVEGTGIPQLRLQASVKGTAPRITVSLSVTQTGVPDDFTDAVPVEIQLPRGKRITRWLVTSSETARTTVPVAGAAPKTVLDPSGAVLRD